MRRTTTPSRFTLIELLVVVSIIAVLAAMLLPVLMRAKQKAVSMQCLNKLKQMGTATQMYFDEYDDWFPVNQWYMYADAVVYDPCGNPYEGNSANGFTAWQFHEIAPYLGHPVSATSTPRTVDTNWAKDWECPNESRALYVYNNADRQSIACAFGKLYGTSGGIFGYNSTSGCVNLSREQNPNACRGNLSGFRLNEVGITPTKNTSLGYGSVTLPALNCYNPDRIAMWWDHMWSTSIIKYGNNGANSKQYPSHGTGGGARFNATFVDGSGGEYRSCYTTDATVNNGGVRTLPYLDKQLLGW